MRTFWCVVLVVAAAVPVLAVSVEAARWQWFPLTAHEWRRRWWLTAAAAAGWCGWSVLAAGVFRGPR